MFYYNGLVYATFWQSNEIKNGTLVNFSTSEKRQDNGERIFSSWSGVAYGKAADLFKNLKRGDFFIIKKAKIERAPYEKNGEKIYDARVVLFEVEPYGTNQNNNAPTAVEASEDTEEDPWG